MERGDTDDGGCDTSRELRASARRSATQFCGAARSARETITRRHYPLTPVDIRVKTLTTKLNDRHTRYFPNGYTFQNLPIPLVSFTLSPSAEDGTQSVFIVPDTPTLVSLIGSAFASFFSPTGPFPFNFARLIARTENGNFLDHGVRVSSVFGRYRITWTDFSWGLGDISRLAFPSRDSLTLVVELSSGKRETVVVMPPSPFLPQPGSTGVVKLFILPGSGTGVTDTDSVVRAFQGAGVERLLIDWTNNGGGFVYLGPLSHQHLASTYKDREFGYDVEDSKSSVKCGGGVEDEVDGGDAAIIPHRRDAIPLNDTGFKGDPIPSRSLFASIRALFTGYV
ncbi:hypothetical protein BDY19DRAFT_901398 [Irpex rosettiformis]|uniref:Uncharacterized protein n=1 Tax=Irpex rosettiformis TaxID=378272 RepID=A0ACB8UI50_9APHY|nr:hypothetical protein BDY19DRAFT_901398 [Irpex rosettiformis]